MESSSRLEQADWLKAGIEALAKQGSSALKADTLAKRLGVSRGSFYWHFENLADFHASVLRRWEEIAVDRPYAFSAAPDAADAADTLGRLVDHAFNSPIALEAAVAAWATEYPAAAAATGRVNARRSALLASLFRRMGFGPEAAKLRATIVLSAYLGRLHLEEGDGSPQIDVGALAALVSDLEAGKD